MIQVYYYYMPPSLKQRLLGVLIDYIIILIYIGLLLCTTLSFYFFFIGQLPQVGNTNPWLGELIGFITLTVPVSLYFIVTESGKWQASFGKRVVHIKITDHKGNKPSLRSIIVRTIIKFLPWELAHICIQIMFSLNQESQSSNPLLLTGLIISNVLLLLYILTILFRHDHGGPYDVVARTRLIKTSR